MSEAQPTMLDIVSALEDVYLANGVAIVLSQRHKVLSPSRPLIERCQSPSGRRDVYAWACSLSEIVAT